MSSTDTCGTRGMSGTSGPHPATPDACGGPHAESLRQRKAWFRPPEWPSDVAWWVDETHQPTWDEAVAKLERLHAMGSTPAAFTFKQAFDAAGRPTEVERHRVKRIVEQNGEG